MVGGGLAQVGGKAHTSSAVRFSPPLAPSRLLASRRFLFRLSPPFLLFLSVLLFLPLKTPCFCRFRKKLSTIGIFIFIFLIFCALRPLSRPFLYFLSTLFRQAFRRSGRGFFLCVFWWCFW